MGYISCNLMDREIFNVGLIKREIQKVLGYDDIIQKTYWIIELCQPWIKSVRPIAKLAAELSVIDAKFLALCLNAGRGNPTWLVGSFKICNPRTSLRNIPLPS